MTDLQIKQLNEMFLNKDNMPRKNNYSKVEISSDSTDVGKIIFTV